VPRFVALSGLLYVALSAVGHPLSVVKTRLQHAGSLPGSVLTGAATQQRSGDALRLARRALGLRGLYVGFWPATLGALPSEAAYVVALEGARQALAQSDDRCATLSRCLCSRCVALTAACPLASAAGEAAASFAAGAAANCASQLLLSPVEVVVARAVVSYDPSRAAGGSGNASVADVARATWRAHGLRGFYAGYGAALATYAPGCAVWWSCYAAARRRLLGHQNHDAASQHGSWAAEAAAGGLAGVASAVATHPLDTVKTRLQSGADGPGARWADSAAKLLRTAGARGLLRGLGARTLEMSVLSAVAAVGYEQIKRASLKTATQDAFSS